ncbi:CHAT domain-containing protein [Aurantibacter sp.]|uniref:CHAT domain-containing protein n=1 Tax=Aurantibacter sp. TaxID=2807103 RepID=UPI0032678102
MKYLVLLLVIFFAQPNMVCQDSLSKEQLIEEYYSKGISLRTINKDSSYYYFDSAYNYSLELSRYSDGMEVLISAILTSTYYYDLGAYESYLNNFENLLSKDAVRDNLDDLEYYDNRFAFDKASYFYDKKDYENASKYFQRLYAAYSEKDPLKLSGNEYGMIVHTLNYLGLIYTNTDKFDLAENYFNQSISFVHTYKTTQSKSLERATIHLLSKLYTITNRYEEANLHLQNILGDYKILYVDDKEYKNNIIAIYQKLVANASKQNKYQKAINYLKESENYLLSNDSFQKQNFLLYGDLYAKQNQDKKALLSYQKALDEFLIYRQNKPHEDVAKVYGKIAELQLKQKKYGEGLESIKKGFNFSGRNIRIVRNDENPDAESVFSKNQLLYLLDIKLQLLIGMYKSSKDEEYLKIALSLERDMLSTFDLLKKEFDSKLDKQYLAEKVYPVFERMLDVVYLAYEKNHSEVLLELAINISEKGKDFLLLEALRSSQATKYSEIPKGVLDRETQIRAQITKLEKEIFDANDTIGNFSDELFKLKQEYYSFLDTVKHKYPKYHDLKYRETTLNLRTIRNLVLEKNSTLISYTLSKDNLYVIVLNNSKSDFYKLSFDEGDRELVSDFYQLISKPSMDQGAAEVSVLGETLFNKLLRKPLENYESENLTIIPDGELHYLPFDLLQWKDSYLLETKNIGYGNSVTSLLELRKKAKSNKNRVLAFAPSFDDATAFQSSRQFGKLLYNDDEVSKISAFYETKAVIDDKASLAAFKANSENFNIIHLATHASANDAYPDYSYLAFSQQNDSTASNILYIKDLYNTSLNADMITLSACQTGIGKLQKGQGMLSLSKGFYYAGAKSLVNTLWKINDKSSVKLMEYFYEELSEGKSKSKALQNAKLKYLQTTEDNLLRHPYYWSAFVVSGDITPLTTNYLWWYVVSGIILIIVFLGVIYFKRKASLFR